jgi:hypothetical protein
VRIRVPAVLGTGALGSVGAEVDAQGGGG